MTYLSWALFAEGSTDAEYFSELIPRVVLDLLRGAQGPVPEVPENPVEIFGVRPEARRIDNAARAICAASDAFQILFVHSDTGGRGQQSRQQAGACEICNAVFERCEFPPDRCIIVGPTKETEAWSLSDEDALRFVFGLRQNHVFDGLGQPGGVERLDDPKATAERILREITGARRPMIKWPYAAIAQRQRIEVIATLPSFQQFRGQLVGGLRTLGYPGLQ